MKQLQLERIIKEELDNVREEQNASLTDKMISALEDIGVDTEEDTVDVEITDEKTGKTRIVTLRNGEFSKPPMEEDLKSKVIIACTIAITGLVSCNKEESYNLAKDARYIMKPNILNTQGRKAFDSPVSSKDKIYVWAGNQSGGRGTASRVLYHDYSNSDKNYGAVFGQNYPDSFAYGSNGVTPIEVVKKVKLTPEIAQRLQPYTKADLSQYTDTSTVLGKTGTGTTKPGLYVIIVKVHGSSYYDWADPGNGQEIKDSKWNIGYAIYLVTSKIANGINVGEMYPTMMEVMFNFYNSRGEGTNNIKPFDDYFNNNFKKLLPEIPSF
jgi:hypothetical protein